MSQSIGRLDPQRRAAEKQAARERDDQLLRDGIVGSEELQQHNSMFASFDIPNSVIVRGRRSVRVAA